MEIVFAYLAGILTLINPCILPVLPIALVSSLNSHKLGPVALAIGMCTIFTLLGLFIASIGPSLGIDEDTVSKAGAVMMIVFGIVIIVPQFRSLASFTFSGVANNADSKMNNLQNSGLTNQFLGGALLGAVWSPCIGPTLGGAISLASEGGSLFNAALVLLSFSIGVSTIILIFAYGARETIIKLKGKLKNLATNSGYIIGGTFLAIGLMLFFNIHYIIEGFLLDIMPYWLQDLSVKF